jgi:ABC-2 type transport system permease protein
VHRALLIAKRDYLAAVKTKSFLVGLIVAPLMFGGGFIGIGLMRKKPDIADRKIAVVDRTGKTAAAIVAAAAEKNGRDMLDKVTGRQIAPKYVFEMVTPETGREAEQRLALSERVRKRELYGFLEIGAATLHAPKGDEALKNPANRVDYYANAGGIDQARGWLSGPIADGLRRARLTEAGVAPERFDDLLAQATVQAMSLVSRDERTGSIAEAKKKNELEAFVVPFATMMLLAMIVLASASPMLGAVADDKTQRVFEMLLGSATPFELMLGKVLGAVALALTSSVFYVTGGLLVLQSMAMIGMAPMSLLPWFFVYLVADVMVLAALGMALGAACGSPHDAQQLAVVLLAPVIIPLFLMMPVIQNPNGTVAVVMSLIPPVTPILMMLRQAMPGGVPGWQPWAGLVGVALWTIGMTWAAARIFRVVILVQGKLPKFSQLVQWAIKG